MIDLVFLAGTAALLLVLAAPECQRAYLRRQAQEIRLDLEAIEQAVAEAASALDIGAGETIPFEGYARFLKDRTRLRESGRDVFGNEYGAQRAAVAPSLHAASFERLKGVAEEEFWKPYPIASPDEEEEDSE